MGQWDYNTQNKTIKLQRMCLYKISIMADMTLSKKSLMIDQWNIIQNG